MNEWLMGLIGLLLGAAVVAVLLMMRRSRSQTELNNTRTRAALLEEQLQQQVKETERVQQEREEYRQINEESQRKLAVQEERVNTLEQAEQRLKETFAATGSAALQANTKQFLELATTTLSKYLAEAKGDVEKKQQAIDTTIKPIRELLEKQNTVVQEIEKKREGAYRSIEEQIKNIVQVNEKLDQETGRLVSALRRPEQRGKWGEMQLRNVVELAGMTEHCDFDVQHTVKGSEGESLRPDMIIHMPGEGLIVVDSKVALDAYLDGLQPDADREAQMKRHANQTETHYKSLAGKKYWAQFERAPKLVVMFMPLESALVAALDVKPNLHAEAMQNHVLIATPTLLVALLRAVAYGWQQEDVAANARQIANVGSELYDRLAVFTRHIEKVGKGIDSAARSYNSAIGSLESRVLPSARDLKQLHATTEDDIELPPQAEIHVRDISVGELRHLPGETETDSATR